MSAFGQLVISTSLEACSTPELKSQNRVAILLQNVSISLSFLEFTPARERSSLGTAKVTPSNVAGSSKNDLSLGPGLRTQQSTMFYSLYLKIFCLTHMHAHLPVLVFS